MDDVERFLTHAIQVERDAARRFEELAESMKTVGNGDTEACFRQMAVFSRQHLAEATARAGFRSPPQLAPDEYEWPDGTSPETAGWEGVDGFLPPHTALELALDSERRGHAFYAAIAATTRNPEVKVLAEEFAAEEAEHVAALELRLARALI
ncbi:ferritin family protein [Oryzomicrobium sp.]|uniref:ferritin family protein n=1 Tax=Oryzomicrobium sp. TaxID=1911578 RepID=UPI002FE1419D